MDFLLSPLCGLPSPSHLGKASPHPALEEPPRGVQEKKGTVWTQAAISQSGSMLPGLRPTVLWPVLEYRPVCARADVWNRDGEI